MASTHSSRGDVSESPTFRDQGDFKNLPLHAALANSRPTAEIIPLLEFHDASVADDQGCLPLHYACGNNAPPGVVSLLVKAFPGAVAKKDNAGQLPLHWAAQRKAVLEVRELRRGLARPGRPGGRPICSDVLVMFVLVRRGRYG